MDVAGAEMFVKFSLPLSRFVTVRLTFAGLWLKLATLATQCASPVFLGIDVGEQSCVSVTTPCRLLNATGIVTSVSFLPPGSSVMRPKYWPVASSGALIVIQMSVGSFLRRWMLSSDFGPFFPGALSET